MDHGRSLDVLYTELEKNPEDVASYLVLADALLERGDPRGELIQLQHRLAQGEDSALRERERALLAEHAGALFGDELAKLIALKTVGFRLHLGFFEEVELLPRQSQGDLCRAASLALRSPAARLLRSLKLAYSTSDHSDHPTRAVLRQLRLDKVRPPATLGRLQLGAASERNASYWIYRDYESRTLDDDLSGLLELFPRVEALRLDLGVAFPELGELASDALRDFEWVAPFLAPDALPAIAEARWPALERLVLWTGAQLLVNTEDELYVPPAWDEAEEEDGDDVEELEAAAENYDPDGAVDNALQSGEQLEPLLASLDRRERLRCFGLANFAGSWAELLPRLAAHAFWPRLETLDLSRGTLDGGAVEALARLRREAPGKLRTLRVDGAVIDAAAREALAELGLSLEGEPVSSRAERFRYVVTME